MDGVIEILLLGLPLMILSLLAGLGLSVAALANEGRGRASGASRIFGWINLALTLPMILIGGAAEARDVRMMFAFAAAAFCLVGLLGLRLPLRARDDAEPEG